MCAQLQFEMHNSSPFQFVTSTNSAGTLPGSGIGVAAGSGAPGSVPSGPGTGAHGTLKWSSVYGAGANLQFGNSFPPRGKGAKPFMPNTQHLPHSKKKVCR